MESETYVTQDTASETPESPGNLENEERRKSHRGKLLGRPRKTDIIAKKKPGKIGRPLGDAAILNEYKARMLNSPKSKRVLQKIIEAALDDEHKHQAVAWKIVSDRIAPVAIFDNEVKRAGTGNHISITISGVPTVNIDGGEIEGEGTDEPDPVDEIEAEFEEITDEGL